MGITANAGDVLMGEGGAEQSQEKLSSTAQLFQAKGFERQQVDPEQLRAQAANVVTSHGTFFGNRQVSQLSSQAKEEYVTSILYTLGETNKLLESVNRLPSERLASEDMRVAVDKLTVVQAECSDALVELGYKDVQAISLADTKVNMPVQDLSPGQEVSAPRFGG